MIDDALAERFERMVDRSGEHHLWTRPGVWKLTVRTVPGENGDTHRVHRTVAVRSEWEATGGACPLRIRGAIDAGCPHEEGQASVDGRSDRALPFGTPSRRERPRRENHPRLPRAAPEVVRARVRPASGQGCRQGVARSSLREDAPGGTQPVSPQPGKEPLRAFLQMGAQSWTHDSQPDGGVRGPDEQVRSHRTHSARSGGALPPAA